MTPPKTPTPREATRHYHSKANKQLLNAVPRPKITSAPKPPKDRIYKATGTALTRKQTLFVKHLVENPTKSATEAAVVAYGKSRTVSGSIATENLQKPLIRSELSKYNNLVETTLVNTISDWGRSDKLGKRTLAVDTAKFIHDKVNGKAKQQIDISSTSVTLSLDLTGTLSLPTDENEQR